MDRLTNNGAIGHFPTLESLVGGDADLLERLHAIGLRSCGPLLLLTENEILHLPSLERSDTVRLIEALHRRGYQPREKGSSTMMVIRWNFHHLRSAPISILNVNVTKGLLGEWTSFEPLVLVNQLESIQYLLYKRQMTISDLASLRVIDLSARILEHYKGYDTAVLLQRIGEVGQRMKQWQLAFKAGEGSE